MQRDGEFDDTEAGAEVAAAAPDRFDQVGAQFLGDGGQFVRIELAQVAGGIDARKARVPRRIDHPAIFAAVAVTGKEGR